MMYELEIIADVTTILKDGTVKVIKRSDKIKKLFDLNEVEIEEFVNSKTGKHSPRYTGVLYKSNYFKVNKPYEQLKQIIENRSIPIIGLMGYSKYKKK